MNCEKQNVSAMLKDEEERLMPDLYEIASAFRDAIEEAIRAGEIREMMSFPAGCCGYTADILQRYLFEQGIITYYMSGRYGHGDSPENHAWIETKDGVVIDITGDQYKYMAPWFTEPVYVGPRENGFHDKFELDEPVPYLKPEGRSASDRKSDARYEAVLTHMRNIHTV